MSKEQNKNRRRVVIGLGSGLVGASQLPKSWSKPVINSVILPSHAVTTGSDSSDVFRFPAHYRQTGTVESLLDDGLISSADNHDIISSDQVSTFGKLSAFFIQDAHALVGTTTTPSPTTLPPTTIPPTTRPPIRTAEPTSFDICFDATSATAYSVKLLLIVDFIKAKIPFYFEGNGVVGSDLMLQDATECFQGGIPSTIRVSSMSESGVAYKVMQQYASIDSTAPIGTGCPASLPCPNGS